MSIVYLILIYFVIGIITLMISSYSGNSTSLKISLSHALFWPIWFTIWFIKFFIWTIKEMIAAFR